MKNFIKSVGAWLKSVGVALIEARQKSADRQIAMMHLYRMSDRELKDIGITRSEIKTAVSE